MRQRWVRRGLVHRPQATAYWTASHAQIPTPLGVREGEVRVWYAVRDEQNCTLTAWLDLDAAEPARVLRRGPAPVMPLGAPGCFDDRGVMPSSVVAVGEQLYLYYIGWNTSTTVPYRNASSAWRSATTAAPRSAERFDGPLLDRTADEPHFSATPFVLREGSTWRMWYLSCTEWRQIDDRWEPRYLIRQTESEDGIHWRRPGSVAIDYRRPDEADCGVPWVVRHGDGLCDVVLLPLDFRVSHRRDAGLPDRLCRIGRRRELDSARRSGRLGRRASSLGFRDGCLSGGSSRSVRADDLALQWQRFQRASGIGWAEAAEDA